MKLPWKKLGRLLWLVFSGLGLLPLAMGTCIVLFVTAHAGMIDPALPADERRAQMLARLTEFQFALPITLGLFLIAYGTWVVSIGCWASYANRPDLLRPPRWSIVPPIMTAAAIATSACYLSLH